MLKNDLLLRAARGERTERTPVWLMRQAGRFDPMYQAVRRREDVPLEELFRRPLHPYTQLLLKSIPRLELTKTTEKEGMKGEPSPSLIEKGCFFQPRCPHSREKCLTEEPLLLDEGGDHFIACHFVS